MEIFKWWFIVLCSKPERSKLLVLIASLEVDEDVHNTSMSVGHPPKEGALKINVDRALVRQMTVYRLEDYSRTQMEPG